MAKKGGNGHDPASAEMVALLRRIADRLDSVENQLSGVRGDIQELRGDVQELNGRIDNLLGTVGASHRALEDRVAKLELRVDRLQFEK